MTAVKTLTTLLEPVVEGLGYELVGIQHQPSNKGGVLRVFIDNPAGIGVDDCARVSHQVSGVLDVENPIAGEYALEVSSPGLDRPIFKATDYDRFAGELVRVRLRGLQDGRRKYRGYLVGLRGSAVVLIEDEAEVEVPLERIDRAHVELQA